MTARPRKLLRWSAGIASLALVLWVARGYRNLPDPAPLAQEIPGRTALQATRLQESRGTLRFEQRWVPLDAIAPVALQAVLLSEDASFYLHHGVDYGELWNAMGERLENGGHARGASTLTQQLARNLWLSEERSLIRKLKELILARRLETRLSKKRILALYVNVVEWGPGVFGIEAAARHHFGVPASALSVAQAVVLASMLPAPRKWGPRTPSPIFRGRCYRLVDKLLAAKRIDSAQARDALEDLDDLFPQK